MKPAKGFGRSRSDRPEFSPQSLAPYVRTLPSVIDAMLEIAQVRSSDCVYDLGCGDGRILIRAAQHRGVRGLGVDLDPERIQEARRSARELDLVPQIAFKQQDLLTLDLSPASVVIFFLLPESNLKLRAKLHQELRPGSRIVTHSFDMGDWVPTEVTHVSDVINTYPIYLWQIS